MLRHQTACVYSRLKTTREMLYFHAMPSPCLSESHVLLYKILSKMSESSGFLVISMLIGTVPKFEHPIEV